MKKNPVLERQFIFLKAPFKQAHASTIVEIPRGFLAAWFGGEREGAIDVGIWGSIFEKGKWSDPFLITKGYSHDGMQYPCWNPVLFRYPEGRIFLFYKVGPSPSTWWGQYMICSDDGISWERAEFLPTQILGPIKNKPILLSDGRLLCGSSTENKGWRIHFEWTKDKGQNWYRTPPLNDPLKFAAIQPAILQLSSTHLRALGRTRQRKIFAIDSLDGGFSWGEMRLTQLPNPNSGIDAVTLRDGRHLLVYNHNENNRSPLNIAISEDGNRWYAVIIIEDGPGEYSYPALIQDHQGLVHLTYTWRRERIAHVILDPASFQLQHEIINGVWPSS